MTTRLRVVVAAVACLVWAPKSASAQHAPALAPWLHDWGDYTWLQILDRNGGNGGRFSERGLLRRFDRRIDAEYRLDLLSRDFALADLAEWQARANGLRWRAGSITKRDMATTAEFKGHAHLSRRWVLGVRADLEESPQSSRASIRAAVTRALGRGYAVFAESGLDPIKPGSDVEFGAVWRHPRNPRTMAGVSVAVLDWFSDFIYINLDAASASEVESTLVYERQPLAARARFTIPLVQGLRLGAHGAYVRPSRVAWYDGVNADSGISQAERMGFAGVLLEWHPAPRVRIGGLGTYVRSEIERRRLAPDVPLDEFDLVEATRNIGVLGAARLGRSFIGDLALLRVQRVEERVYPSGDALDVDYLDAAWVGRALVTRRPVRGFTAELGVVFDTHGIERGAGQPAGSAARAMWADWRLLTSFGWRFDHAASFVIGMGIDLDADANGHDLSRFDGIRGRFNVSW